MTSGKDKKRPSSWIEDRPPRRGGAPTLVGQVLAETQKIASTKMGAALSPDEWEKVVGPKIAARTRVGRLSGGTLIVHAASSAWCNELSFLTSDIIARLRSVGWQVDTLRVRVANFDALSVSEDTPPVARAPLPTELEARLALIEDPVLRSAIAEAAALSLARRKP